MTTLMMMAKSPRTGFSVQIVSVEFGAMWSVLKEKLCFGIFN